MEKYQIHQIKIYDTSEAADIKPMLFGYQNCFPGMRASQHKRARYLVHYVLSGQGHFYAAGKHHLVSSGDIFVITPDYDAHYEADEKNPWSYIWIAFSAGFLPLQLPPVVHCPSLAPIFEKMKRCMNITLGRNSFLKARIWDMLYILQEQQPQNADHIQNALNIIHAEYMTRITVSDIADRLNLDRRYFSSLFKKKAGISPRAFLIDLRLENAAQLMLEFDLTPSAAAHAVGYNDIYLFSRIFKKKYGMSPRAYKSDNRSVEK